MMVTNQLRRYWHNFYYFFAGDLGERFALTCREAAEHVDLGPTGKLSMRFRFILHVSLCQGCANYRRTAVALGQAIRSVVCSGDGDRVSRLTKDLLRKHSSNKS